MEISDIKSTFFGDREKKYSISKYFELRFNLCSDARLCDFIAYLSELILNTITADQCMSYSRSKGH